MLINFLVWYQYLAQYSHRLEEEEEEEVLLLYNPIVNTLFINMLP